MYLNARNYNSSPIFESEEEKQKKNELIKSRNEERNAYLSNALKEAFGKYPASEEGLISFAKDLLTPFEDFPSEKVDTWNVTASCTDESLKTNKIIIRPIFHNFIKDEENECWLILNENEMSIRTSTGHWEYVAWKDDASNDYLIDTEETCTTDIGESKAFIKEAMASLDTPENLHKYEKEYNLDIARKECKKAKEEGNFAKFFQANKKYRELSGTLYKYEGLLENSIRAMYGRKYLEKSKEPLTFAPKVVGFFYKEGTYGSELYTITKQRILAEDKTPGVLVKAPADLIFQTSMRLTGRNATSIINDNLSIIADSERDFIFRYDNGFIPDLAVDAKKKDYSEENAKLDGAIEANLPSLLERVAEYDDYEVLAYFEDDPGTEITEDMYEMALRGSWERGDINLEIRLEDDGMVHAYAYDTNSKASPAYIGQTINEPLEIELTPRENAILKETFEEELEAAKERATIDYE